jgi:uncharacterized protein DUF2852
MGVIAARLDEIGRPAWIMLTVLGFILFWPIGLAMLAFVIGSGRMGCWRHRGFGRWHNGRVESVRDAAARWYGGAPTSGNRAFDEYRTETLRRLEDEQREFKEFLDRLRFAKDKAEFDEFLAERRRRGEGGAPQPQQT